MRQYRVMAVKAGAGAWELPKFEHLNRVNAPAVKGRFGLMIPHTGEVTMHWAQFYRDLVLPEDSAIGINRGLPVDLSRDAMTYHLVYEKQCEWVGYLDSDVIGDPEMFLYLVDFAQKNSLKILSGMYYAKQPFYEPKYHPCAWLRVADGGQGMLMPVNADDPQNWDACFPVDAVGFGCIVVHHTVFRALRRPWFMFGTGRFIGGAAFNRQMSEDFYFCERAKELGILTYLNTNVRCYHMAMMALNEVGVPCLKAETDYPKIQRWGGGEEKVVP